ncbi:M23 family metallopeptidase [Campylobacter sp. VBCF_05 NA6]|uniref:M23 family metallopeptidase n=1 Tax=unclassified Campylobacter TaxID=2593542 RepID=UPI0022E9A813|nr:MULTISPECIES: M23 family metallopeptidase [unclassified Campylobacter]MDA3058030.1 M23 family metallopeptidase [Campylobacter sp. VBCF_04 NA7]MDA3059415.1 M23 family metallopeptidase [Campylobacter sp. VBCF_05 NA6]
MAKTKITISDNFGSKTMQFGENFRFQLKILVAFIIVFLLVLFFALFRLNNDKKNLKTTNATLMAQIEKLEKQNQNLIIQANQMREQTTLDIANEGPDGDESDAQIAQYFSERLAQRNKSNAKTISANDNTYKLMFQYIPNRYPIKNRGITDNYGMRTHPIAGVKRMHHGIDLRASVGTPVIATADGFVDFAGESGNGYGILVRITHNYGFSTRYGHLSSVSVAPGMWVSKGTIIGYTGNTGYSTGPHLHYEVRFLGMTLDPLNFMLWDSSNLNIWSVEPNVSWYEINRILQSGAQK